MKITKDTKISDLIPEGWKLSNRESSRQEMLMNGIGQITIPILRKEVKDFDWYWQKYSEEGLLRNWKGLCLNFKLKDYDGIPFEMKIGLLKFICDDIKIDISQILYNLSFIENAVVINEKLSNICPKEFLDSIFL